MAITKVAPNGKVIEFPDGTSDEQIKEYLNLPEYQKTSIPADEFERGALTDIPLQIVGGIRDGVQSTLGFVEGLSDTLGELTNIGGVVTGKKAKNGIIEYKSYDDLVKDGDSNFLFGQFGKQDAIELPDVDNPDTILGGLTRGVSQFATGWVTGGRLLRGASSFTGTKNAISLSKAVVANPIKASLGKGVVADVLAFDGEVGRFSDIVNQYAPALSNPLTDYLASDPNDGFWEGRFKNALEGLALGGATESIFRTARYIKNKKAQLNNDKFDNQLLQQDEEYISLYHGTGAKFDDFDLDKTGGVVWFTTNKKLIEEGAVGASSQGRIIERFIKEGELKLADRKLDDKLMEQQLIDEGYDGVKYNDLGDEQVVYKIFNPDKLLKTKPNLKSTFDEINNLQKGTIKQPIKTSKVKRQDLVKNIEEKIFNNFKKLQGTAKTGGDFEQKLSLEEGLDLGFSTRQWKEIQKEGLFTLDIIAKANAKALARLDKVRTDRIVRNLADRKYGGNIAKVYDDFSKLADNVDEADSLIYAHEMMMTTLANLAPKIAREVDTGASTIADFETIMALLEGSWFNTVRVKKGIARTQRQMGVIKQELESVDIQNRLKDLTNEWRTFGGDIKGLAKRIAQADDPRATQKVLEWATKNKSWNVLNEVWINALLSNPKTHLINTTSNLINTFLRPLETYVGSFVRLENAEKFAKIREQGKEAFTTLAGLTKYLEDVVKYTGVAFRNADSVLTGGGSTKLDTPFRAIKGKLGNAVRYPTKFLNAEDEFFKQINYRAKMYQIAVKKALEDGASKTKQIATNIKDKRPITEFEEVVAKYFREGFDETGVIGINPDAMRYAQESTYTQELFGIFAKVQQMTNAHPYLKQVIPFVKTPINLMMSVVDRTPLGFMRKQFRDDFFGRSNDLYRTAQVRGQLATGFTLITLANILASTGAITGSSSLPDDAPIKSKNLRDLNRNLGFQPYSFRTFNEETGKYEYTSFGRLDPFGAFFGLVADFHTYYHKMTEEELALTGNSMLLMLARQGQDVSENIPTMTKVGNYAQAGWHSITRNLLSKTYLKGLTETLEVLTDDNPAKLQRIANSKIGSFVPNIFTKLVNDPFYRDAKNIIDEVKKRTGAGYVQKKYDFRGNAYQQQGSEGERIWNNVFNPFTTTEQVDDPVAEEIIRLGVNVAPISDIYNGAIDLKVFNNKNGVNAYDRLNEILSNTKILDKDLNQALKDLIGSDVYKNNLSDPIIVDENNKSQGGRAREIKKLIKRYHQSAEIQLLNEMNSFISTKDKTGTFSLQNSNFKAVQNKTKIGMGLQISSKDIDELYKFSQ